MAEGITADLLAVAISTVEIILFLTNTYVDFKANTNLISECRIKFCR